MYQKHNVITHKKHGIFQPLLEFYYEYVWLNHEKLKTQIVDLTKKPQNIKENIKTIVNFKAFKIKQKTKNQINLQILKHPD